MTLTLTLLVACGDNITEIEQPPIDEPAGRTLTGSHVVHFLDVARTSLGVEPIDLWSTVIEAQVPDGDGWRIRPGHGHRDGSFEIPDVDDGHVWLRFARRPFGEAFYWTDADHVAFDENVMGPEVPDPANDGDRLQLAVDGLAPWQAGDELAWFVPDDLVFDMNLLGERPPADAATDLATAVDWTGRSLADVGPGEPAYVVQYRTHAINGVDLRTPVRAARPTIHQVAGTDGTLAATFSAPAALAYRFDWARDAFEAQRTAIHPTRVGASVSHGFNMFAAPGIADGELWTGVEYPLVTFADPALLEDTTRLDLGTLAIPNPFPEAWLADIHVVTFPVDLPLPDGTPQTLEAVIGVRSRDLGRQDAVTPGITPLRTPLIAGRDAFVAQTGVGLTPSLAWTPPAVGTSTSHMFKIVQAITNPPPPYRPGWYLVAELVVPGDVTQIRLPADVLRADATYAILVRTFAQPGQDVRARPFVARADAAFADSVFGPFTP